MDKGQVTAFVVLGLILLAVVGGVAYLTQEGSTFQRGARDAEIQAKADEVRNSLVSCLEEASASAVYTFGLRGLQFVPDAHPRYTSQTLPSLEEIEQFLGRYVQSAAGCEHEAIVESSEPSIHVAIEENQVLFTIDYPVEILHKGQRARIDDPYTVSLPVRLVYLWGIVKQILTSYEKEGRVDMALLASLDLDAGVSVTETEVVYALHDFYPESNPYVLMFGVGL